MTEKQMSIASNSKASISILVAEDDEEDRMLLEDAWEECQLSNPIDMVEDGIELLQYLRHEGEYQDVKRYPTPGLILLDLNMPRMDGREALREIKADKALRKIPVVILTTSQAEEDILRTYGMGASSFITKPVNFDNLIKLVKTLADYWLEIVRLNPKT